MQNIPGFNYPIPPTDESMPDQTSVTIDPIVFVRFLMNLPYADIVWDHVRDTVANVQQIAWMQESIELDTLQAFLPRIISRIRTFMMINLQKLFPAHRCLSLMDAGLGQSPRCPLSILLCHAQAAFAGFTLSVLIPGLHVMKTTNPTWHGLNQTKISCGVTLAKELKVSSALRTVERRLIVSGDKKVHFEHAPVPNSLGTKHTIRMTIWDSKHYSRGVYYAMANTFDRYLAASDIWPLNRRGERWFETCPSPSSNRKTRKAESVYHHHEDLCKLSDTDERVMDCFYRAQKKMLRHQIKKSVKRLEGQCSQRALSTEALDTFIMVYGLRVGSAINGSVTIPDGVTPSNETHTTPPDSETTLVG